MDADNISKHIPNKAVKMYMIISAMGIVLVFESANHIDSTSISPLWNGTISFMVLTSYMSFLGIYSVSLSVSEGTRLRKYIRTSAQKQGRFLDYIGTAEMTQEIERRAQVFSKIHIL